MAVPEVEAEIQSTDVKDLFGKLTVRFNAFADGHSEATQHDGYQPEESASMFAVRV